MSTSNEPQEQVHFEEHQSLIKTPKQLVVTVILSFIIPIVIILLLVSWVTAGDRPSAGSDALSAEATALRIAPVARIEIIDTSAPAELKSGEQVYTAVCAGCHANGVAGAHKFADQAKWTPVIATGLDAMVANAIKGKGAMPAKGGNPTLQDIEITRAVVYMANAAGGKFEEPAADAAPATKQPKANAAPAVQPTPPVAKPMTAMAAAPAAAAATPTAAPAAATGVDLALGARIYNKACVACHSAGVAGAPKTGDKASWAPYVATGMDTMIAIAIKGKGAMPARGGLANASDADIAAAVHYMISKLN